MDESEDDVLAYMAFPAAHRTKLHSVNTLERLNKEVKRRADVVGIFPSEQSIVRLVGAVLLEANDGWKQCFQPAPAPLLGRRSHGRAAEPDAHQRHSATATQGRLSRGRLSYTTILHHVDGRDLHSPPRRGGPRRSASHADPDSDGPERLDSNPPPTVARASSRPRPKPHPGRLSIGEFRAGRLEGGADGRKAVGVRRPRASLEIHNCLTRHLCMLRQVGLAPA
jgi:hypothetical protein